MYTLRIEHGISDFGTWKAAFDNDPARRQESGVVRYSIHQPVDDEHYVLIDLEFDQVDAARAMLAKLRHVWESPQAAPALAGLPRTSIIDTVQTTTI